MAVLENIIAQINQGSSVLMAGPSRRFLRELNQTLTYQYQVIWETLSGQEASGDGNPEGLQEVTDEWTLRARVELLKAFGDLGPIVEARVMALSLNPALEHSWGTIGQAMREMLADLREREDLTSVNIYD